MFQNKIMSKTRRVERVAVSIDEPDLLLLLAVTAPSAGEAAVTWTVSPLVAKIQLSASTAAAPVLRPDKVMVKAVVAGIAAVAVVIVILFSENAEVAVKVATEDV